MIKRLNILITVILIFLFSGASYAKTLHLVTEEWPPYEYDGGRKGISVEIIQEVCKQEKIPIQISANLWGKSLNMIKNKQADGIFTIFKSNEREKYLYYPSEILFQAEDVIFFLKKRDFKTINDLKGQRIGLVAVFEYDPKFQTDTKNSKIDKSAELPNQLINKLLSERIDAALINKFVGIYILKQMNKLNEVEYMSRGYTIDCYLAFSKKPQNYEIMKKFETGLKKFKKTEKYKQIINKYLK